jgi:hypothetical protein
MALISTLNNQNDDLIELNRDSFNNQAFNFNIPRGNNNTNSLNNELFNRKKISDDVISMSSASSSRASSPRGKQDYIKNMNSIYKHKDKVVKKINRFDDDNASKKSSKSYSSAYSNSNDSEESDESAASNDSGESRGSRGSGDSGGSGESDGSSGSRGSGESDGNGRNGRLGKYNDRKKYLSPKELLKLELNEKREIIYQLDRLESKGFKLPFKFNMNSDLEEMKTEYNRIIREKELDGSVRFQQKMLMAFISGTEYLNSRYDPLSIRLDGWSEQVNENINDYDDIFEELHYKYKATGKKMAPELRLFMSLSGSAFMFHLTSRMFKEQPLPDIENVLKSNPDLMKQFQNAAAKQYIIGNNDQQIPQMSQNRGSGNSGNDSMGLFNMVSNLFGSLNSEPPQSKMPMYQSQQPQTQQQQSQQQQRTQQSQNLRKPTEDIDNIIRNVHSKISIDDSDNNIETLSVSDEEITSIIEDTADIQILKTRGRPKKGVRTLNI